MKSIKYLLALMTISLISCEIGLNNCIDGDGNRTEREISIDGDINSIEFKISGELILSKGETQSITIEGDQNIVDLIESESSFRNNNWEIEAGNECIDPDGLKIFVQLKSINTVTLLGSGVIKSDNTLKAGDAFKVELDGSGKIDLKLESHKRTNVELLGSGEVKIRSNTEELALSLNGSGDMDLTMDVASRTRVDVKGSGEVKLDGSTDELSIDLLASADIKADGFRSQDCTVNLAGSGDIEVYAENTLEINITGSGDVCYKGNPTVTINVTGSGDVKECN